MQGEDETRWRSPPPPTCACLLVRRALMRCLPPPPPRNLLATRPPHPHKQSNSVTSARLLVRRALMRCSKSIARWRISSASRPSLQIIGGLADGGLNWHNCSRKQARSIACWVILSAQPVLHLDGVGWGRDGQGKMSASMPAGCRYPCLPARHRRPPAAHLPQHGQCCLACLSSSAVTT